MDINLIGAASDLGVSLDGSSKAPELLLQHFREISSKLISPSEPCIKSLTREDKRKNEGALNRFNAELYSRAVSSKASGSFTVFLGGDHSCAIPSVLSSVTQYGRIGVMWIDAHTDYNTFRTTETGNIHGLPLACISGFECGELREFHSGGTVDPQNICVIGARSIDRDEKDNVKKAGIHLYSVDDLRERGIAGVMEEAFSICLNGTSAVHVSFDLDVIDPTEAPGVSVPEKDGITKREALLINSIVSGRIGEVCSYDLVELNPLRDIEGRTETTACRLLDQLLVSVKSK